MKYDKLKAKGEFDINQYAEAVHNMYETGDKTAKEAVDVFSDRDDAYIHVPEIFESADHNKNIGEKHLYLSLLILQRALEKQWFSIPAEFQGEIRDFIYDRYQRFIDFFRIDDTLAKKMSEVFVWLLTYDFPETSDVIMFLFSLLQEKENAQGYIAYTLMYLCQVLNGNRKRLTSYRNQKIIDALSQSNKVSYILDLAKNILEGEDLSIKKWLIQLLTSMTKLYILLPNQLIQASIYNLVTKCLEIDILYSDSLNFFSEFIDIIRLPVEFEHYLPELFLSITSIILSGLGSKDGIPSFARENSEFAESIVHILTSFLNKKRNNVYYLNKNERNLLNAVGDAADIIMCFIDGIQGSKCEAIRFWRGTIAHLNRENKAHLNAVYRKMVKPLIGQIFKSLEYDFEDDAPDAIQKDIIELQQSLIEQLAKVDYDATLSTLLDISSFLSNNFDESAYYAWMYGIGVVSQHAPSESEYTSLIEESIQYYNSLLSDTSREKLVIAYRGFNLLLQNLKYLDLFDFNMFMKETFDSLPIVNNFAFVTLTKLSRKCYNEFIRGENSVLNAILQNMDFFLNLLPDYTYNSEPYFSFYSFVAFLIDKTKSNQVTDIQSLISSLINIFSNTLSEFDYDTSLPHLLYVYESLLSINKEIKNSFFEIFSHIFSDTISIYVKYSQFLRSGSVNNREKRKNILKLLALICKNIYYLIMNTHGIDNEEMYTNFLLPILNNIIVDFTDSIGKDIKLCIPDPLDILSLAVCNMSKMISKELGNIFFVVFAKIYSQRQREDAEFVELLVPLIKLLKNIILKHFEILCGSEDMFTTLFNFLKFGTANMSPNISSNAIETSICLIDKLTTDKPDILDYIYDETVTHITSLLIDGMHSSNFDNLVDFLMKVIKNFKIFNKQRVTEIMHKVVGNKSADFISSYVTRFASASNNKVEFSTAARDFLIEVECLTQSDIQKIEKTIENELE